MQTFKDMVGFDCGRNIDRQISAILDEFHRNVERLCKEDFDRLATANGYVKAGEETTAIIDAITIALSGCTDFEGLPPSKINYLQCIRKLNQPGNGYVPAADYEALKAKLAELTDQLTDATSTLDQIEAESACFDGLARSAGYVKLEPGQVVVNASDVGDALDALCDTCAGNCEMCPTREILFAIKEARDARV